MKKLVFAELSEGITTSMMEDPKVYILSDGALFLVTTPKHASTYPHLTFFNVDMESSVMYNLDEVFSKLE